MIKKLTKPLPKLPGIYLFKDANDTIIYIGKAKSLHHRVTSYFNNYKHDWKVQALLNEYATIDHILTTSEIDAMLLEAELIAQHKPKYNVLLKEGNPFLYIMITKDELPQLKIVRNKKEKGRYFGPFLHKTQARKAVAYLMHTFRLNHCNKKIENGCLDYHIGNCAGTCLGSFNKFDYLFRVELAVKALEKNHTRFVKDLQQQIKEYSKNMEFEKARNLNYYLENISTIFATIDSHYSPDKYTQDIADATLNKSYISSIPEDIAHQLQLFLGAQGLIETIDCFDISHFQSKEIVGSCIRFKNGKPDKNRFRRFKIKSLTQQNDYAALQEIIARRYRDPEEIPDLILIDGGKGQLSAAQEILPEAHIVSLAKKEERLFGTFVKEGIQLDLHTPVGKLLIELRDYAHHFAITYHRLRRKKTFREPL